MDRGAWWAAVHGVAKGRTRLSNFTFTFYFHALEKEMATHSSILAWRIPGMGEPGGLLSMGLQRVGHDWSNLAAAAAAMQRSLMTLAVSVEDRDRWCYVVGYEVHGRWGWAAFIDRFFFFFFQKFGYAVEKRIGSLAGNGCGNMCMYICVLYIIFKSERYMRILICIHIRVRE